MESLIFIKNWLLIFIDKVPIILDNFVSIVLIMLIIEATVRYGVLIYGVISHKTKTLKDDKLYNKIISSRWYNLLIKAIRWTYALFIKLIRRSVS